MGTTLLPLSAEVAKLKDHAATFLPQDPNGSPERAGLTLGRFLSEGYDAILRQAFGEDGQRGAVALVGVGSYGRGAVAWGSDLDVRIIVHDSALGEPTVRDVIYPLWDASLSVGHQVLLVSEFLELAREDVATQTTLLDMRFIAGDRQLMDEVKWRASGLFSGAAGTRFAERLSADMLKRHDKFGDSPFLLEPDVKNSEGGLRDLDVMRWVARSRFGVGEFDELLRIGAIGAREAAELRGAEEFLWRIRNVLHHRAGRRSDRLTFDAQESIAPALAFGSGGEAVERLMSEYYRAARSISRRVGLVTFPSPPRRRQDEDIGDGMRIFDGAITTDIERFRTHPEFMFQVIASAVAREIPLSAFVRQAIMRLTSDLECCAELRQNRVAKQLFIDLITTRKEARLTQATVARELHDLGLLLAMIPEFLPVLGRVHHDAYHVYTVDVHSVRAVDRFAALARGEHTAEFPLASRLAAEVLAPRVLGFAILLHDVGKAIGGKDHSIRGAEMARTILERLDFAAHEIEEAARLISEHLTLYRLATRRDVDDPATIEEVIAATKGQESLRNLYILTVCDVSTTSPTSLTAWRTHLLDALYVAAEKALSGERETGRVSRVIAQVGDLAAQLPASEQAFVMEFVKAMPDRYLISIPPAAMLDHARTALRQGPVRVSLSTTQHMQAAEVCVVAEDRPGLLAIIARALSASRLEVLAAQLFSRRRVDDSMEAVDLFWVQSRVDAPLEPAIQRVERDINAVLRGELRPEDLREPRIGRSRGPVTPTRVLLDHRACTTHTVIEVTTSDRPGVLFTIAQVLFELGLSIAIAKINTEGARVADVFYVTDAGGGKLDKSQGERVASLLLERLAHETSSADSAAAVRSS